MFLAVASSNFPAGCMIQDRQDVTLLLPVFIEMEGVVLITKYT